MPRFAVRALELHSAYAWDIAWARRALDFIAAHDTRLRRNARTRLGLSESPLRQSQRAAHRERAQREDQPAPGPRPRWECAAIGVVFEDMRHNRAHNSEW